MIFLSEASRDRLRLLCQDVLNHVPMHIGQAEIATLIAVGESLVVESQLMQDRGLQIVDMHGLLGHMKAEFVR